MSCPICERDSEKNERIMCKQCCNSFDRSTRRDDGTIWAAMEWAAKRARYFAKLNKTRLGIGGGK